MAEYFKITIEKHRDREADDKAYPVARKILEQEIDPKNFDLTAVIQAVNMPILFDLRKTLGREFAEELASTPHQSEPLEEVMDSLSMKQAEVRIAIVLDRLDPTHAIANHRQAAARILLEIFPGYRTEQEKQNLLRPEDGPRA